MQARRACSIAEQPAVLYPDEAQHAVERRHELARRSEPSRAKGGTRRRNSPPVWIDGKAIDSPRTEDMMAMHGCSLWRFGFLTRRTLSGGSRMGLCVPVMMGDW